MPAEDQQFPMRCGPSADQALSEARGAQAPRPTGSAVPLRAAQPVPLELDGDGAVRMQGDMRHGVAGDP